MICVVVSQIVWIHVLVSVPVHVSDTAIAENKKIIKL